MTSNNNLKRISISDTAEKVGKTVKIAGWVDVRRDHGKLIFIDLRDASGKIQMVALPNHKEAHEIANKVRPEWVIEVEGIINARPEKMVNPDLPLGKVELEITGVQILNEAKTPVFEISGEGYDIGEDNRLKYRYLDLRRNRLQKNLKVRHKVVKFIRDYLSAKGFMEIETPLLTKATPEGARDFIVPSRLSLGYFYALPQAPQQFKQLLMTSGVEKYFQIAKCLRDEDSRGDRQPEFTQLDLEMAFVNQEDVISLNEALLIELVKTIMPDKKIQQIPFPRITYKEAMEKYGIDRPDLREDKNDPNVLAFCWVIDFPFFEKIEGELNKEGSPKWTFTHNPFSSPQPGFVKSLMNKENIGDILAAQYDIVLNGFEIGGGSIRNHKPEDFKNVLSILGHSEEEITENFGHMLEAFSYGAPPHGGIAWGLDRLISIFQNEPNIREVIAFPKNGEGRDLMMNAPSRIKKEQLDELGIEVKKEV